MLFASAALFLLFATPVVLDRLLNHPNNLHKIRTYLADHRGERNALRESAKYELSFFTFTPDPDVAIENATAEQLISAAAAKPYVLLNWVTVLALAGAALVIFSRHTFVIPPYLVYCAFQVVLVAALFLYWALRITGPLYNFNGFFFYAVQFAGLFMLVAILLNGTGLKVSNTVSMGLACAVPLLMFSSPGTFQRIATSRAAHPSLELQVFAAEAERIADNIPRQSPRLRLHFRNEGLNWALAMGIASRLHWAGQPLCVDERSAIWLEDRYVCQHLEGLDNLALARPPATCEQPCITALRDDTWSATLTPFPALKLPFTLDTTGSDSLILNFYDPEDGLYGPVWSKKQSMIRFLLSPDWNTASPKCRSPSRARPFPVDWLMSF